MFYIGVDLGQSHDPTAIAVVEQVGDQFRCGHLERLPLGTPYPAVVGRVAHLMSHPTVAGNVRLAIDATGVGRPVCDMFAHAGIRFVGIIITAGHGETYPGGNYRHVPKITLISHVQALLHAGHLKIRQDLPEADNLVRELQDFRVNYSASGFMSFNAREGKHDDLVLALAVAIWCALRQRTGSESWDEYLDDWSKRRPAAGVADTDPVRASGPPFGWNLRNANEPLHKVWWPETLVPGTPDIRYSENKPYKPCTRSEAKYYLSRPAIAALNEALARELGEANPGLAEALGPLPRNQG
jgi:hypothetical protein